MQTGQPDASGFDLRMRGPLVGNSHDRFAKIEPRMRFRKASPRSASRVSPSASARLAGPETSVVGFALSTSPTETRVSRMIPAAVRSSG